MTQVQRGRENRSAWRRRGRLAPALIVIAGLLLSGSLSGIPVKAARGSASTVGANKKLHSMLPKANRQSGSLADIINLPYPPMEFKNPGSSNVVGFDITMARGIAAEFGVKLQFQNVLFAQ